MTTTQQSPAQGRPVGSGLPPAKYPRFIFQYMKIDKFLVRWFSYSLVTASIMKANGVANIPVLILTTKGHKSGKMRDAVLPYYRDGEHYAVIGSLGGAPDHPHWIYNVMADPLCEIRVNRRNMRMRGHIAQGEEHQRIWAKAVAAYPYFLDYAVKAYPRQIPCLVLEEA